MAIVLFGSMEHDGDYGDAPANGGYKLQALWVKMLREHGVEAYRVTRDGTLTNWLIEPPPVVSLATARAWAASGRDMRVVSTWMDADVILDLVPSPYWFDAELGHSAIPPQYDKLCRRLPTLAGIGVHSRTLEAWYMATLNIVPVYIQEWSDTTYWYPDPDRRVSHRVGYMNEGAHTAQDIALIRQQCLDAGIPAEFVLIHGDERTVRDQMQTCDVFLGLNVGKHALYGEGCPRSQQEAMHCGCVVIAYNVLGNREYLLDGYTGYLARRGDAHDMARILVGVLSDDWREEIRARGTEFVRHQFAPTERKWQQVKDYLNL